MNFRAKAFQQFIDDQKVAGFSVEEFADDAIGTAFQTQLESGGQLLPATVLFDDSVYAVLRIQVTGALTPGQRQALLAVINELNSFYKPFKYAIFQDARLYFDACVPSADERFDPELLYEILHVMRRHLAEQYAQLMRIVWSEGASLGK